MSGRLTRKDMKHDKFLEDVGDAYTYANRNRRNLLLGLAAVVLLAAALSAVAFYRKGQQQKAQGELAEAIAIIDAPSAETPGAAAADAKYKTEAEKLVKAKPMFVKIAKEYSGSDAGDVAEIYLARVAAAEGDTNGARTRLEGFVRHHPDHILAAAAQQSLYELRLQGDQAQATIKELEQKLNDEGTVMPKDAILSLLARAYELTGDQNRAREAYRRLVNEFPDSPYAIDAQRKLAVA